MCIVFALEPRNKDQNKTAGGILLVQAFCFFYVQIHARGSREVRLRSIVPLLFFVGGELR
jgi:hypothetical protein